MLQEGVIQALYLRNSSVKTPLLAAVGPLQFEVVQFRLESEYGAESRLESAPWTVVRWLPTDIKEDDLDALSLPTGARLAYDIGKNPVVLFQNEWSANYFGETNKNTSALRAAGADGEGVSHRFTQMKHGFRRDEFYKSLKQPQNTPTTRTFFTTDERGSARILNNKGTKTQRT